MGLLWLLACSSGRNDRSDGAPPPASVHSGDVEVVLPVAAVGDPASVSQDADGVSISVTSQRGSSETFAVIHLSGFLDRGALPAQLSTLRDLGVGERSINGAPGGP